jgi:hypothetical protein
MGTSASKIIQLTRQESPTESGTPDQWLGRQLLQAGKPVRAHWLRNGGGIVSHPPTASLTQLKL